MMNIDAILEKIAKDARHDAETLVTAAHEKADVMQAAFDDAQKQKQEFALDRAHQEAVQQRDRMLRMAGLEARKKLLELKRAQIDQAFELALKKMLSMPKEQAQAFHLKLLVSSAQGSETLFIAQEDAGLFDDAFMTRANQALVKAGKPGALNVSKQYRPLRGGFMLLLGGMEANCSYESLLRAARNQMEGEVASILFPA